MGTSNLQIVSIQDIKEHLRLTHEAIAHDEMFGATELSTAYRRARDAQSTRYLVAAVLEIERLQKELEASKIATRVLESK